MFTKTSQLLRMSLRMSLEVTVLKIFKTSVGWKFHWFDKFNNY